jgi:hypothetical protein
LVSDAIPPIVIDVEVTPRTEPLDDPPDAVDPLFGELVHAVASRAHAATPTPAIRQLVVIQAPSRFLL